MAERKLTEKQRRFVEAYMGKAAGNATDAARRAGYKGNANTLHAVGVENLQKPTICNAIQERVDADPAVATRETRQRFWTDTMGSKAEAMKDRLRASELLGKSQADFVDRVEHTGKEGTPLTLGLLTDEQLKALEAILTIADGGQD